MAGALSAPPVRVVVVHGGDNDSLNLVKHLSGLFGVDMRVTDGKHHPESAARSLQRECGILMICGHGHGHGHGHGYRDGDKWCMGGFKRGWLTPSDLPQPLPAKLVVFDACGVTDDLLRDWQQSGYLAAEIVVAYGGGQRAREASLTVRPKQNLVVECLLHKLIDARPDGEADAASCSPNGLRKLLERCIQEEAPKRSVYHLFPKNSRCEPSALPGRYPPSRAPAKDCAHIRSVT